MYIKKIIRNVAMFMIIACMCVACGIVDLEFDGLVVTSITLASVISVSFAIIYSIDNDITAKGMADYIKELGYWYIDRIGR